jgi:putative transposase
MMIIGEDALRYVLTPYPVHSHGERNHQGLDNHLIAAEMEVDRQTGHVVRRERLGGLLSYYHREAA